LMVTVPVTEIKVPVSETFAMAEPAAKMTPNARSKAEINRMETFLGVFTCAKTRMNLAYSRPKIKNFSNF